MYQMKPDLTAEYILGLYPQEQIMERYLGVPIKLNTRFLSPLRKDNNPTCGFFYTKEGTLIFKDFAGFFAGGCFKVVMHLYTCSFHEALELIASDLNLIEGVRVERKNYPHLVDIKRKETTIQIKKRPFNDEDRDYWQKYGLKKNTLLYFKTYPITLLWLNGKIIYNYKKGDPAYAYCYGEGRYKIYFPLRKLNRFMCNCSVVQGEQIPRDYSKGTIITKSMKDVMVLYQMGYTAVAPQSETVYPDEEWINDLRKKSIKLVSLYDFDRAGVTMANYMRKKYGIHPCFLTDGRFGSQPFAGKDISDLVEAIGYTFTKEIVDCVDEHINKGGYPGVYLKGKDEQQASSNLLQAEGQVTSKVL